MRKISLIAFLAACGSPPSLPAADAAADASDVAWGPVVKSSSVTWTCIDPNPMPDCPWGDTVTVQAAVFDRDPPQAALSYRLGYTVSDPIYLPRPCSDTTSVRVVTGEASVWEGDLHEERHTVIAHLRAGDVYTPVVLPENNVLSVQADTANAEFEYQIASCR